MVNEYVTQFDDSLEGWTDERFITRRQVRALAMFSLYLVNLAEEGGWRYTGHSFRDSEYMALLVVKGVVDGIPSVVFTNAKTYTSCVEVFLRKLGAEQLEWREDRFAR